MKNGVPFDVAFSIDEVDREAWKIVFDEFDGAQYDHNTLLPKRATKA